MKLCLFAIPFVLLFAACSDPPAVVAEDAGGAASSSSSSGSSSGGASDLFTSSSSSSSSSGDSGAANCHALGPRYSNVPFQSSPDPAPAPQGGTFEDGKYDVIQLIVHGASAPPQESGLTLSVEKTGSTIHMYSAQDGRVQWRSFSSAGPEPYLWLTQTCPAGGGSRGTLLYTMTPEGMYWYEDRGAGQTLKYVFRKRTR